MAGIAYRPEIDGLRAFAVLPVILFHMSESFIPGGYLGVDVFFVISGFLITSIIYKELDQDTFSFRNFWARRIRRILPAMIVVTASTLAISYFFVFRPDQQDIERQGLAALLSVANIYFWQTAGDYWGTAAEHSPFLHTWSLSVEEQFYLFFPLGIYAIFRVRSKAVAGSILTAVIASLALFLWGSQAHPTSTFYLLPTRVWELGTGCLLAVLLNSKTRPAQNTGTLATAGLCLIMLSYVFISEPSGAITIPVIGTALILAFGQQGVCQKILSTRWLVHIGKISYSLYLWHWPLLVFSEIGELQWEGNSDKVLIALLTYALAFATYKFIETPMRKWQGGVPAILASGGIVAVLAVTMSFAPRFYDTRGFNTSLWMSAKYDLTPTVSEGKPGKQNRTHGIELASREHSADQFLRGGIVKLHGGDKPKIVVLGDSHAVMWAETLNTVAAQQETSVAFYAMSGRDPFCQIPPTAKARNANNLVGEINREVDETMIAFLSEWKPTAVIISCFWNRIEEGDTDAFLKWLRQRNIRVFLVEDPPNLDMLRGRNALQFAAWHGVKYTGDRHYWRIKQNSPNKLAHRLAAKYDHVSLIPTYNNYANGDKTLLIDDRDCVYVDSDHLTNFGASLSTADFTKTIISITSQNAKAD